MLKNQNEKGATLLLSILVLAAMSSIIFAIALIATNETRTSGDLIKSEPAITAAEAGAEDLLYYNIRNVGTYSSDCTNPTSSGLTNIPGLTLKTCSNPYFPDPVTITIPPNSEKDLFLYDPAHPDKDASGYTGIAITMLNGLTNGTFNLCSWTYNNCSNTGDIYSVSIASGTSFLSDGSPVTFSSAARYQVVLKNNSSAGPATFQIYTVPKGMPSGQNTILTTGSNGGVTRKVQTNLGQ